MIDELKKHVENGCNYGQADGPDDVIKECECAQESELIRSIKGPWQDEPDYEIGEIEGYTYLIDRKLRTGGHLCGYVKIPFCHKVYGKGWDEISMEVHGGLTYAGEDAPTFGAISEQERKSLKDGWWIGFDCAHYKDLLPLSIFYDRVVQRFRTEYPDTVKEMMEEYEIDYPLPDYGQSFMIRGRTYKDMNFVRDEIKKMIKQLNGG